MIHVLKICWRPIPKSPRWCHLFCLMFILPTSFPIPYARKCERDAPSKTGRSLWDSSFSNVVNQLKFAGGGLIGILLHLADVLCIERGKTHPHSCQPRQGPAAGGDFATAPVFPLKSSILVVDSPH